MRLRGAIAATAAIGAAIATYLTVVHYAHVAPVCTTGGCEKVQRSSYAELAGVSVALRLQQSSNTLLPAMASQPLT